MPTTTHTTVTDDIMQFVVFAIEAAAQKMQRPSPEIHNRLRRLNLIDTLLIDCYDTLHTQSKAYIADAVEEAIVNWEAYNKETGRVSE